MRKIFTLCIGLVAFSVLLNAQFKLSSSSNAFIAGDKHNFVFVNATTEGNAGKDITWDFTGLQATSKTLTTNMALAETSVSAALIPNANVVIEEAGNFFFFKVTSRGMEQYGSASACAVTRFDKPLVKLQFPCKYGDKVSGDYAGVTIGQNNTETKISGTYEVVADAFGTLLLPENVSIKDALRVKQTRTFAGSQQKEITYRWYAKGVRYPVLVVIKYESANSSNISQAALYGDFKSLVANNSDKAIKSKPVKMTGVEVSPNPTSENITISYILSEAGDVTIDLIGNNGNFIKNMVKQEQSSGPKKHSLPLNENPGVYYIRVSVGSDVVTKKVVRL